MMLKLHGFNMSNYYNMVKLALALKEVDYQAIITYPGQTPEFLALSPMGKVPVLETEHGTLVETNVILEYLDQQYPQYPLYPQDAYAKARVQEITKIIELYIELPARRCFGEAFFGGETPELTKTEAQQQLSKGVAALKRVASFSPYLAGEQMTAADIMFLYTIDLAGVVTGKLFDWDILAEFTGAEALLARMNGMPQVQQIAEERTASRAAFFEYIAKMSAAD